MSETTFGQIQPKVSQVFQNDTSFGSARGHLASGNGCGHLIIRRLLGEGNEENCPWKEHQIKDAITHIKTTGLLTKAIGQAREISKTALVAREKRQKQAEKEAEKARKIGDEAAAKAAEDETETQASITVEMRGVQESASEKNPKRYDQQCDQLFVTKRIASVLQLFVTKRIASVLMSTTTSHPIGISIGCPSIFQNERSFDLRSPVLCRKACI
jgi:hypothetical protein